MKQRKTKKAMMVWALAMLGFVPTAHAQDFVTKIEAESATLTAPVKVKPTDGSMKDGLSGGKYVGDNDYGSAIEFKVVVEKAGTYEFRTHYLCSDGSRAISVKVNSYKEVISRVGGTTDWDNPPTKEMKVNIYMDAGENTFKITPYPNEQEKGGPNIDYFEIYTSKEVVLPEVDEFPKVYEAETAELYGDLKVKPTDGSTVSGLSGGKYIGDFNQRSNSYVVLPNVEMPEAGTYELKVFSMGSGRRLSIKVNQYERTIITTKDTPGWDSAPSVEVSTLIYLDKGKNKIVFNSYNDDGPNLDKFEIHETDETIERPEVKLLSFESDYTDGAVLTAEFDNETLKNVADNDEYTVYMASGKKSAWVVAECEYPVLLTGYLLSAGFESNVDVSKWTLESSADGKTWKTITPNKVTDLSGASLFEVGRNRDDAKEDRARYYRLTATGETDVEIAEWQLFGSPYLDNEDGRSFPADITEGLDIHTIVSAYPEGNKGDSFSEEYYNLFDRDLRTKYCMSDTKSYYVEVALDKPYKLEAYTLTSVDVDLDRAPKKWTFNGYNEQTGWVELDRRTEYAFPCGYATMRFAINSEMGFTKFLLDVEDNNGSEISQILKFQLFGEEYVGSGVELVDGLECVVWSEQGKICINQTGDSKLTYQVFDLSGVSHKQGNLVSATEEVALAQGMYVVSVSDGEKNSNVKVFVK